MLPDKCTLSLEGIEDGEYRQACSPCAGHCSDRAPPNAWSLPDMLLQRLQILQCTPLC